MSTRNLSGWRSILDLPHHKKRVSLSGITIEETKLSTGEWRAVRVTSDGRRYEATNRSRTAARKETQRMANR